MIAHADNVAVDIGEERELQHDDLCDTAVDDDFLEIIGVAQDGNAVFGLFDLLVADEADGAQPDVRFTTQPAS